MVEQPSYRSTSFARQTVAVFVMAGLKWYMKPCACNLLRHPASQYSVEPLTPLYSTWTRNYGTSAEGYVLPT